MTDQHPALIQAKAIGVLGEYDHRIEFREDDDFMIVYGPNGVGKTRFLEIIHALSRLNGRALSRMPFDYANLKYSDGSEVSVERFSSEDGPADQEALIDRASLAAIDDGERRPQRTKTKFTLLHPGAEPEVWDYEGEFFDNWLIDNTPWRPYDDTDDIWEDRRDGELAHITELRSRYPQRGARRRAKRMPVTFEEFRGRRPSYLIETQRLRTLIQTESEGWRPPDQSRHSSRISENAATMRRLVNNAQTEHSAITQQRDRTFPNRVLSLSTTAQDATAVRLRYEKQNDFRSRLGRVASVELADALSLPERPLDDWELRLLDLYLDDADAKLAPFETLIQKIELLEEIINSRLLKKRLQVTARDGLLVQHDPDGRAIDLDSLSSGEQHEIILMFDLLFNVPRGALVLIDEPEISLHVIWQLAFIPDVRRIAELAGFRFVVATHSPQIINDAWKRAIRLGPEEVPFQ